MNTKTPFLPKEVTALVHHIELNRAGWWEKAIHRLTLAAVWLSDHAPSFDEIQTFLNSEFHLPLSDSKLHSVLESLESQTLIVRLPGQLYRIPDQQRITFKKEIAKDEEVASAARDFFFTLVESIGIELDPLNVWSTYESDFLSPLVEKVGANAYRLIIGEPLVVDKGLGERFLSQYGEECRSKLTILLTKFLDPQNDKVRAYVSRMLHARFCVEASGLPQNVIDKLNTSAGKQIHFRVFVDTNFLFSVLELHENPSNIAARELLDLISRLKSNPKVDLVITPCTVEEAKSSIISAMNHISDIRATPSFMHAALQVGFSGMIGRFLVECQKRKGDLTPDDWFNPYLKNFAVIARGKGVELFNENLDSYATKQDVVDDILDVIDHEKKLPEDHRKSYKKVEHDIILWHCVNDKRPSYVESPLDAKDWILTVDFRLLGFDEYKRKKTGATVPICLHPTTLIQLLQFWVPRTKELEEALLGSLCLPFLFHEFDADAEITSLNILRILGRFEGADDIPEQTITNIVLDDALRARLKYEKKEEDEIVLIRDALIEEMKARVTAETNKAQEMKALADAEANKAQQLSNAIKEKETAAAVLDAENRAKDVEIAKLKIRLGEEEASTGEANKKIAELDNRVSEWESKWQIREETKKKHFTIFCYFGILAVVILVSVFAAYIFERIFPSYANMIGMIATRILVTAFVFVIGHLFLECWAIRKSNMAHLWIFKQIRRFRKWLWILVILAFVVGVLGNLCANKIQKNIDQDKQPNNSLAPISKTKPKKD